MIAIVDSGSTKGDWIIVSPKGEEIIRTKTIGLNPYFINSNDVIKEIYKNKKLLEFSSKITHIFFYGAGCSNSYYNNIIKIGLDKIFTKSINLVKHDLLAAAYACFRGNPIIACILGTGSNSCFFDGKNIREETPSLSFILGDEGSGSNFGKKVIKAFFLKKMPKNPYKSFKNKFNLTYEELSKNIYGNPYANTYLASFSRFVLAHKHEPFIQKIIYESLNEFIVNQILVYPEARFTKLSFVGSIAHYYKDILLAVVSEYHLTIGQIIKHPIDNLVNYHLNNLFPKLGISL